MVDDKKINYMYMYWKSKKNLILKCSCSKY